MKKRIALAASLMLALAACQDDNYRSTRHLSPIPPATMSLMASKGMSKSDPIVIRSFKKESEMEIWKRGSDGKYALLKTYPICRWSGQLGPKIREGDRQAPEGFYSVTPAQMNPNSSFYLSFDTGYPNAYDRAHGRTGSHLMVHGSCSSRGCFAMTDEAIAEVYAIAREAFAGGQRTFQFQSYPFRMTPKNLAQHRLDPNMPFWKNLKEGYDYFEVMREEPKVAVCGRRYTFGSDVSNCSPSFEPAVAEKQARDEREVAELVSKGTPAIKLVYEDGGQHASFQQVAAGTGDGSIPVFGGGTSAKLGDVSRPEALAQGPREIILDASGKPKAEPAAPLAYASATSKPEDLPNKANPENATAISRRPAMETPVMAAAAESKPLYQRMLGGITDLFGGSASSDSAPATAAPQPNPAPARRGAAAPTQKPQAAL